LSGGGKREAEARASAAAFLDGAARATIDVAAFKDGYFPYQGAEIKDWFETLKLHVSPDLIFCHWERDAHQDHRQVARLAWNTFRDHLILEYEVPKWDGDLGRPNVYMPVKKTSMARKVSLLLEHFGTQRSKDWFLAETFLSLARIRGTECRAPDRYAEAFHVRKLAIA
jgi:LmbE family N-acetylglucosaminyl deacetylase